MLAMSTLWLVYYSKEAFQDQCVYRTKSNASRATEASVFIHLKHIVWNPCHAIAKEYQISTFPLPLIFQWRVFLIGMQATFTIIFKVSDSQ